MSMQGCPFVAVPTVRCSRLHPIKSGAASTGFNSADWFQTSDQGSSGVYPFGMRWCGDGHRERLHGKTHQFRVATSSGLPQREPVPKIIRGRHDSMRAPHVFVWGEWASLIAASRAINGHDEDSREIRRLFRGSSLPTSGNDSRSSTCGTRTVSVARLGY